MAATWTDKWGEYPIQPLSAVRVSELLDYATNYGVLNEGMPDGQQRPGKSDASGSIMSRERRTAIKVMKEVLGIVPVTFDAQPPADTWKIIGVDNFNRESVADFLVAEGITNKGQGKLMVAALNDKREGEGSYWYQIQTSDYRLCQGMADLI
jgi:hypothetical protein